MVTEAVEDNDKDITAEGCLLRIRDLERIDQLNASAEKRQNDTFREIELYRELVALRLRKISDAFIAQSEIVPLVPTSNEDSAGESEVTVPEKSTDDD
jgi:hypothetical protein